MRGGPARRRVCRPISSAAAECFGVATIRNAGSIDGVRRFSGVRLRRKMLASCCVSTTQSYSRHFTTWLMVMLFLPLFHAVRHIAFVAEG